MPSDVRWDLAAGFFRYLTKPLDRRAFMTALDHTLERVHVE
jgi:CheY-like chemotaxis protein